MIVEVEIAPRRIADLMVTAIEGGSNYWCERIRLLRWEPSLLLGDVLIEGDAVRAAKKVSGTGIWYDCPALFGSGSLFELEVSEIVDEATGGTTKRRITQADFKIGLKLMAEKHGQHFGDFLNENEDATTADVFLQCVALKDIVYG